jgi:shikimate dehydrogenase
MNWRLGVVGYPIGHSLSPRLHEAGLAIAGLEGTSQRIELKEDQVEQLRRLLGSSFDALSVTMPLKRVAAGLCVELDEVALRTGVVNSLLVRGGEVHGACTDGRGFVASLRAQFGANVEGMNALVLGAGGAAWGIVDALVEAKVGAVSIEGRSAAKVEEICRQYPNVVTASKAGHLDLLVNTVPVGGRGVEAPHEGVSTATICVDIAYEPEVSPWLAQHEAAGCRVANGLAMLAYQAALQMQWWWNTPIDGARLLEAIR